MRQRTVYHLVFCLLLLSTPIAMKVAADEIQWKPIGPGGGGTMLSAAVCSTNPALVLMASDVGGLYRSTDYGATWSVVNGAFIDPTLFSHYSISDVIFEPGNCNIAYSVRFKSNDGGITWTKKPAGFDLGVDFHVIDSNRPHIVYAVRGPNVYRTTDRWETIVQIRQPIPGGVIHSLSIDPRVGMGDHLLACTTGGIYESLDGAETWTKLAATGLPIDTWLSPQTPNEECNRLVVHPTGPTLYMTLKTHVAPQTGSTWGLSTGGVYQMDNWGTAPWGWVSANGSSDTPYIVTNGDFDAPGTPLAGWAYYFSDSTTVTPDCSAVTYTAPCSIRLHPATSAQGAILSDFIENINGGSIYKLSTWSTASWTGDNNAPETLVAQLRWYDANGSPINWPGPADYYWATSWQTHDTTFGWRKFAAIARAPDTARRARILLQAQALGVGSTWTQADTWVDKVELIEVHGLPSTAGRGDAPVFMDFEQIVVDPQPDQVGTVYVGTTRNGAIDEIDGADTTGIWKTTNGGSSWEHISRVNYRDNVRDGIDTAPVCGNGVCESRWENCSTCVDDCYTPPTTWCCGNNTSVNNQTPVACESPGENQDNCQVDCPLYIENPPRPYYEVGGPRYEVHALAIGSGASGHEVLYFGGDRYVTKNGGNTWDQVSSELDFASPVPGTWKAAGPTNASDVYAYQVLTDGRIPERVYYGDADNHLQVSYDGGSTFRAEGKGRWYTQASAPGDSATSIVLDPNNNNLIYLGVASSEAGVQYDAGQRAAVIQGAFNETKRIWDWTSLDTGNTLPSGGGVDLVMHQGILYAAIYTHGVYKQRSDGAWDALTNCDLWTPCPSQWTTYRLISDSGRLYVTVGNPHDPDGVSGDTGIWAYPDSENKWRRISDPNANTANGMNGEPVVALVPVDSSTLIAGTWVGAGTTTCDSPPCPIGYGGDGGIYKGILSGDTWAWHKVLWQPKVTGLAVYPESNGNVLYAFVGQRCCGTTIAGQRAGIYKSVDGGENWTLLPNDGLTNLYRARLYFVASGPHPRRLYAATIGSGVYEGTIMCGAPIEGFPDFDLDGLADCADPDDDNDGSPDTIDCDDCNPAARPGLVEAIGTGNTCFDGADNDCDGVADLDPHLSGNAGCAVNPALQSVAAGGGTSTLTPVCPPNAPPNCHLNLVATPDGDLYETITETGSQPSKKAMTKVWTFSGVPTGQSYELKMEGFRVTTESEAVTFTYKKLTFGTDCDASGTYLTFSPTMTITKPADDNLPQSGVIGPVAAAFPVCIKMTDASQDSPVTTVSLDRLFLFPLPPPPPCIDGDGDGYTASCTSCTNQFCPTLDCDDLDPLESPGLTEGPVGNPTCTDGRDNNCNRATDAADTACQAATFIKVSKVGTSSASNDLVCKKAGGNRRGEATVTILNRDTLGSITNAVVTGNWTGATNQPGVTSTTNSSGNAVFTSSNAPPGSIFTFTVTNVSHGSDVYDPASNNEMSDSTPQCN